MKDEAGIMRRSGGPGPMTGRFEAAIRDRKRPTLAGYIRDNEEWLAHGYLQYMRDDDDWWTGFVAYVREHWWKDRE